MRHSATIPRFAAFPPGMSAALWTISLVILACTPQKNANQPHVSAANSQAAQADLRDLEEQWALSGAYGRRELRPDLETFLERYPNDPSADRARIMLAQIALSERRYGSAETLLAPVLAGKNGSVRDEAQVVHAALLSRQGKPEQALLELAPLEGKLLSDKARDQFYRERIRAALAARRWRLAVDSMGNWLGADGVGSLEVRSWVHDSLVQVPTLALSRLLADWNPQTRDEETKKAYEWLHRDIIQYLAAEAIAKQDPRLARDLLAAAPPWLRASDHGDDLVLLASLAQKDARISGRALGVVVGGDSELLRRRNVRVAAGVLHALSELKLNSKIQFFSAEDRGSVSAALGTLTGLGSTILIGGVDPASAAAALTFARSKEVPVVSLSVPEQGDFSSDFGFTVGVSEAHQLEAVKQALPDGGPWAVVGSSDLTCQSILESGVPVATLKDQSIASLLILGDARCADRVKRGSGPDTWKYMVLGLVGASGPFYSTSNVLYLATEKFPRGVHLEQDRFEKDATNAGAPSIEPTWDWFFTLGYDAVQLIAPALLELPQDVVVDEAEVKARHRAAATALTHSKATLLSSQSTEFDGHHAVRQVLQLRRLGQEKSIGPSP